MSVVCIMEEKVKQALDTRGVHTSFYVPYLDSAHQLFKLSRQQATSGESLAMEAKVLLDKRNGLPAAPMLTALNGWTGCARSAGRLKRNGLETDSAQRNGYAVRSSVMTNCVRACLSANARP